VVAVSLVKAKTLFMSNKKLKMLFLKCSHT
jgi:hypothetical protein